MRWFLPYLLLAVSALAQPMAGPVPLPSGNGGSNPPTCSPFGLGTSLKGWWPMDAIVSIVTPDASGNGNNGTAQSSPTVVTAQVTNGIAFASPQYVDTPLQNLNFPSGTITCFAFNTIAFNNNSSAIALFGQNFGGSAALDFVKYTDGTLQMGFYTGGGSTDTRIIVAASNFNWPTGVWVMYALVWSPSGTAAYIYDAANPTGLLIGSNTSVPAVSNIGTDFQFGGNFGPAQASYIGNLDDVQIQNVALSTGQLLSRYNAGLADCPG